MALSDEAIMRLLAEAVPDMARGAVLGLVPTVRLGTVAADASATETAVSVLVDADVDATDHLNGAGGALNAGQRVVLLFYPPHGSAVIGVLLPIV